jgi:hypothetical protein
MGGGRGEFESVLALVEAAKARLVEAVPSPRGLQRTSVADALLAFEDQLTKAEEAMGEEHQRWASLREAVEEALHRAERLRLEAPPLDYESLVAALGDLISPLEAFDQEG